MNEQEWPPDEWPNMDPTIQAARTDWWCSLTEAQVEQVIHRGWTIHNIVKQEPVNEYDTGGKE